MGSPGGEKQTQNTLGTHALTRMPYRLPDHTRPFHACMTPATPSTPCNMLHIRIPMDLLACIPLACSCTREHITASAYSHPPSALSSLGPGCCTVSTDCLTIIPLIPHLTLSVSQLHACISLSRMARATLCPTTPTASHCALFFSHRSHLHTSRAHHRPGLPE